MKRLLSAVLSLCLLTAGATGAGPSAGYTDVPENAWYAPYVESCVGAGLMQGTGGGRFEPERNVTSVECLMLSVKLHALLNGGTAVLPRAPDGWGSVCVVDADGNEIFTAADYGGWGFGNGEGVLLILPEARVAPLLGTTATLIVDGTQRYNGTFLKREYGCGLDLPTASVDIITTAFNGANQVAKAPSWTIDALYYASKHELNLSSLDVGSYPARRLSFLLGLEEVVPKENLEAVNTVDALPDASVGIYNTYFNDEGTAAYTSGDIAAFYRAGILSGVDKYGTLAGERSLSRAEAAAMLGRILVPELRLRFTLQPYPWTTAYTLTPIQSQQQNITSEPFWWGYTSSLAATPLAQPMLRYELYDESGSLLFNQSGILGMDGQQIAPPGAYTQVGEFLSDGLSVVTTSSGMGMIDKAGRVILSPVYDTVGLFHDGVFLAGDSENGYEAFDANGTSRGHLPNWCAGELGTRNGRALYQDQDGKWGYVDLNGNITVPAQYDEAAQYSEGLAAVVQYGKAGFIDLEGKEVIPFVYDAFYGTQNGYYFQDGAAIVCQEFPLRFTIDTTGKQLSPRRYQHLDPRFMGGMAQYSLRDGLADYGFLAIDGKEHPAPYTAYHLISYQAPYFLISSTGGYNYIDQTGKPVLPVWFREASALTADGKAIVLGLDGVYYRLELEMPTT